MRPCIKLDHNVPLARVSRPPRKPKYPFARMKRGDSFFVPRGSKKGFQAHYAFMKNAGCNVKLVLRSVTERAVEGWRVWRVK